MKSGSCPENITYWFSKRETINEYDENYQIISNINVIPAICSDTTNDRTMKTAENWAKSYSSSYDYKNKVYNKFPVLSNNIKNEPKADYKVVGLERRAQNGRVYKCIDSSGFYFDMTLDVLLDCMKNEGVVDGKILSPLIWCRVASNMNLVRYNSNMYNKVIELQNKKKSKIRKGN